jgi:hypothetical protein
VNTNQLKKSTTGSSYITLVYHLQKYNLLFGNISKVNKCNAENMIPFNIKKNIFFYLFQILTAFNKLNIMSEGVLLLPNTDLLQQVHKNTKWFKRELCIKSVK